MGFLFNSFGSQLGNEPFPAQFTNDKIAALLAQRKPLLVGHDPGGFSSVCNAQVDNWHIQDLGGETLLLTPARK